MSTPERTVETLGAAVAAELDAEYTLIHTYQGQTLDDDVVVALVRGDNPWETKGGESLTEWASEDRRTAADGAVDDLAKDIVRRWEAEDAGEDDAEDADYSDLLDNEWPGSDERLSTLDTVMDRDRSTWYEELVQGHGPVLLRVGIATMNEDADLGGTAITPAAFLDLLGFEHTDHNLTVAAEIIDNASPEFGVAMGYALIAADLHDITSLPAEGKVELRNPHVWLGSPFSGSGWCGDDALTGTLTVHREDLRTDKDAFGYSWSEVVGGTHASYYTGEVVAVPAPNTDSTGAPDTKPDTAPDTAPDA